MTHRRTRRTAFAGFVLVLAIAGGTLAVRSMLAPAHSSPVPPMQQSDPPPGKTITDNIPGGITFVEMAPSTALSSGRHIISAVDAVDIAESHVSPGSGPGVAVMASYGLYSNRDLVRPLPSGGRQPVFEGHPTWLIKYTGQNLYAVGGIYDQMHPDVWRKDVNHEQIVFIDAVTGQFLGGISYK